MAYLAEREELGLLKRTEPFLKLRAAEQGYEVEMLKGRLEALEGLDGGDLDVVLGYLADAAALKSKLTGILKSQEEDVSRLQVMHTECSDVTSQIVTRLKFELHQQHLRHASLRATQASLLQPQRLLSAEADLVGTEIQHTSLKAQLAEKAKSVSDITSIIQRHISRPPAP
eukprot:TRINITY_DN30730_c0_g1_i1.p1 TRINITY_DN30730_c0_g1~~TRINITY_DN30730_c0_g1_i1.p1  ORF type:complete len:171 (+),score=40.83 TRINITY_DN30730_c0_g1_i1:40-552(+)